MFFQHFSTIKVDLLAKIVRSAYLCVVVQLKLKKMTFSRGFNLISNPW